MLSDIPAMSRSGPQRFQYQQVKLSLQQSLFVPFSCVSSTIDKARVFDVLSDVNM